MADVDKIGIASAVSAALREILVRDLDVLTADNQKIDSLLSDRFLSRDEFSAEKLKGEKLSGVAPSFYPALFGKLQEAAKGSGDLNSIDSPAEVEAFKQGLKTLLQSEASLFGSRPIDQAELVAALGSEVGAIAADGFITRQELETAAPLSAIFSPKELPQIVDYLIHSYFGSHRSDPATEEKQALLILQKIRERWETMKQKIGFFQSLTPEGRCVDENAAVAYLPFPSSRVHGAFKAFGTYADWVPKFIKSDPLTGKLNVFDSEIEIPGPNLVYKVQIRDDSAGNCYGTYFEAWSGGSFNVDYGKYFILPTRDGNSILIRRGAVDADNRPDALACSQGRQGWIDTLSAGANRIANRAWTKNKDDEDKTRYGQYTYRDGGVLPLPE